MNKRGKGGDDNVCLPVLLGRVSKTKMKANTTSCFVHFASKIEDMEAVIDVVSQ